MNARSNVLTTWEPTALALDQDCPIILPAETLCLCFTFLPDLRACITVSHVSRFWRATALGFPALWAALELELSKFKPEAASEVLRTALGRSASYPVVFEYRNDKKTVEPAIVDAVAAHIYHIRRLSLPISTDATDSNGVALLARAAPLLEELSCGAGQPSRITPDFLGSLPGRLRALALPCPVFPPMCPALANVTRLTTTALFEYGDGVRSHLASFARLFDLFPRIVELSIGDLILVVGPMNWLPFSPVPHTLGHLTLAGRCNVLAYLPNFQGERTHTVKLSMPATSINDAIHFRDIEHAVELELAEPYREGSMHITVRFSLASGQRRTEVVLPLDEIQSESRARIAAYLARQPLARVARATLPLVALGEFIPGLSLCPSLKEICIVAQEHYGIFPWDQVDHLPQLPPSVSSVVIEVLDGPIIQPNALDVALFLESMRHAFSSGGGPLAARPVGVKYLVRGLPAELLHVGMEIRGVVFEPAPAAQRTA